MGCNSPDGRSIVDTWLPAVGSRVMMEGGFSTGAEVKMSQQTYDVVVATYPSEEAAAGALGSLRDRASGEAFEIVDAAIVGRDDSGAVVIDHPHTSVKKGAGVGAIIGAALGVIFPPGLLGAALVGAGIGAGTAKVVKDEDTESDLEDIAGTFAPGSAGVVVAVDPRWTAEVQDAFGEAVTTTHRVVADE